MSVYRKEHLKTCKKRFNMYVKLLKYACEEIYSNYQALKIYNTTNDAQTSISS
jgi:hypothetical protein